ncbi:MAG: GIY-YIG nuclease family protein [Sulfurimonas sp.]
MSYFVYILQCADDTLYTGIATDIDRRLDEHNSSEKGAKYTRSRRPVTLVYSEPFPDRSSASRREYEIKKKMNRAQKLQLINDDQFERVD